MAEPVISVIVPIFNTEKYLSRCIGSIVCQSLENIEILLIDDGSTDHSGELCDQWAAKDKRIRVIHKRNGGLSDARNAGLDAARGQFIGFVDSDDFIHRDMYLALHNAMIENHCDVAEAGYQEFHEGDPLSDFGADESVTVYTKKQAVISAIMDHHCVTYVWNKLYKRELWKAIRFPSGKIFEDAFTTYKVLNLTSKVAKLNEVFYYYLQRRGSIANSGFSVKMLDHCEALDGMMRFVGKEYPDMLPITCVKYYDECFHRFQELLSSRGTVPHSKQLINKISRQMLTYSTYLEKRADIDQLCRQTLTANYDEILLKRKRNKIKLFFLKKSFVSFYIFFHCFKAIKRSANEI